MLHPRQTGFLTAPQPWVNSKLIEINKEVGSGRVVHRKSPGKSIVDGTGGLLAQKWVHVCECAQKLTSKSSGVVVEWCGALKAPGESMERDREVWPADGGGWQRQVGVDNPKKAHMCAKIENVNEILLKIRVAA